MIRSLDYSSPPRRRGPRWLAAVLWSSLALLVLAAAIVAYLNWHNPQFWICKLDSVPLPESGSCCHAIATRRYVARAYLFSLLFGVLLWPGVTGDQLALPIIAGIGRLKCGSYQFGSCSWNVASSRSAGKENLHYQPNGNLVAATGNSTTNRFAKPTLCFAKLHLRRFTSME